MNDPETNSPSDLAVQVAALRRQVSTLLLALIVMSGTLVAYLGYESHHLSNDIANLNSQVIQPYNQKLPVIEGFLKQVIDYAQAHPDFRPVLLKYGIGAAPQQPANITPPKPAPAAPAAPKK